MGRPYSYKYGTKDDSDKNSMLDDLFVKSNIPENINDTDDDIEFLLNLSNLLNNTLRDIKTSQNVKTILEITILSFLSVIKEKNTQESVEKGGPGKLETGKLGNQGFKQMPVRGI